MENQLKQLEFTITNIYLKNISYLKQNHPKVFEKVDLLSKKIENNEYKENYTLEYKEEGYFDILNLQTNEFVYGINSYIEADIRKKRFDFTQNNSLNLLRINPNNNQFALLQGLGEITPLVKYLNKKIDFSNINFSRIFKIAYLGTGLGIHIYELQKMLDCHSTLIIEDNLEIFRLSLFITDYSIFNLKNRTLILSINETKEEKIQTLDDFEYDSSWMNYNIQHQLFSKEDKKNLDLLIKHFSLHEASMFSYKEFIDIVSKTTNFIKKEYPFLKSDLMIRKKPLKDKKVLIISAGPSIDKNIEWIQKNQHKFVIICVDLILRKLERYNIKPDIITSIDPKEVIKDFFKLKNKDFIRDSSIIFLSQQNEEVIKEVENLNFYFVQPMIISDEPGFNIGVSNVGTFSFSISLFLGANEIYLAGSDAAFNQDTGSRYSDDDTKILIDRIENDKNLQDNGIVSDSDVIEVKGNLKDTVKTNIELLRFKESYETFIREFNELNLDFSFTTYNLSDGVYIEGFTPKDFTTINVKSFPNKSFSKNLIDEISSPLTSLDFGNDLVTINSIIQRVKKFSNAKMKSKDEFIQNKIDLMIWILKQLNNLSKPIFKVIFLKFTDLIDVYINYSLHIKQKDLHSKEFIDNLKKFWSNTLISLLKNIKEDVLKV
ncbi:hypothetical protein CRV00_09175 [Malaciobacter molluscorum]|uniref:motility associated factor glycosyltransferase family protein n=1 Tax=Malaciobacter molluscorum TaxID=1032072 RepID=UPI00100AE790|nr:6-hydroxymethylpterin diphosphokinase MptE-like protein [Malaciobacter molluscorum]RXJ93831.1 hypothetical protein CRV00_09175 [Malaciobacter molluscorum]